MRWRWLLCLALACVAGAAPPAAASGTVALRWESCDGAPQQTFDCASELDEHSLFVVASTTAVVDSLIGIEAVVDLQFGGATLPEWWALSPTGCRAGELQATLTGLGAAGCPNPWPPGSAALVQGYLPTQPRSQPNQARMLVVAGAPSGSPSTLADGTVYSLLRIVIGNTHTIGGEACSGCTIAACLVLNSIHLVRLPGAAPLDDLVTPGAGNAAWATWQTSDPLPCQAVPVRNTTWGTIKSLYR